MDRPVQPSSSSLLTTYRSAIIAGRKHINPLLEIIRMFAEGSEIPPDAPSLASSLLDSIVLNGPLELAHDLWPSATPEVRCLPVRVLLHQFGLEEVHLRK